MKPFEMIRNEDTKERAGTGKVLEGVVFSDGTCVVRWIGNGMPEQSTAVWNSFEAFANVHVHNHPKNSEIIWLNENTGN